MDINDLRSLVTVLGFGLFLLLVVRVWRRQAQPGHQAASRLVFEGESAGEGTSVADTHQEARHG